jgi:hypothetical protein
MKKLLSAVLVFVFFSASAQLTQDDVNLIQSMYGKDKRDIMQAYLQFKDDASAKSFWKLYDSYEVERKKLGQSYIKILQDYANNYEKLTNAKADELVTKSYNNNIAFENLYMKYYKQMKPVVGALLAGQFIQTEAYFRISVKAAILDEIPFIGQIDRTKKPSAN